MPKILIVDDDQGILDLFAGFFEDAGPEYEVKTALNSLVALKMLKEHDSLSGNMGYIMDGAAFLGTGEEGFRPDFMLVDISMPEMDGWEFIQELNRLALRKPELKNTPYLVITGENFLSEKKPFSFEKDRNFKGYYPKMTAPYEITGKIREVLAGG